MRAPTPFIASLKSKHSVPECYHRKSKTMKAKLHSLSGKPKSTLPVENARQTANPPLTNLKNEKIEIISWSEGGYENT